MKPLTSIRVLDFTQFLSGSFCTEILADMGAEVIKLENPPLGDPTRYIAPGVGGATTTFVSPNRGKKSVLMDLNDPRQKEIFFKMVKDADVVVENWKAGTAEKLGISYEVLKEIKPDIILTSISGFGQTGPFSRKAAFDLVIQAFSGLMSVTGPKTGEPTRIGNSMSDIIGGLYGCIGTLVALCGRFLTGEGRHIDISMVDSSLATLGAQVSLFLMTGVLPVPIGNRHPQSAPFQPFTVKGGDQVFILCSTDEMFSNLCGILGCPDLVNDPRFINSTGRVKHVDELEAILQPYLVEWTAADIMAAMEEKKIACGKLNNIEQIVNHEQTKARKMIAKVKYLNDDGPVVYAPNTPLKMTGMEEVSEYYAYPVGYHTLSELGKFVDEATLHEIYDSVLANSAEAAEARMTKAKIK